jgi:ATP-binding cassette, subfamily C (CFTR/MRP), member 1
MLQRMGYGCMCVGIRVRAALTNAICRRSFSMASIEKDAASDAVSFVASDINKVRSSSFFPSLFGGRDGMFSFSSLARARFVFPFRARGRCCCRCCAARAQRFPPSCSFSSSSSSSSSSRSRPKRAPPQKTPCREPQKQNKKSSQKKKNQIYDGCQEIHYLWTAPIEAGAILIILAILVGVYALPGWGVIMIVLPAQYFFGWKIIQTKVENAKNTQARGGIIQELLPAMKLVKYYAWEQYFERQISVIRKRELKCQARQAAIKTINTTMVFGTPPTTACVIFACYQMLVGRLPATLAFTTLSLFNILRFPLVVLPKALRAASDAYASMERVEAFLIDNIAADERKAENAPGVRIRDAEFVHPGKDDFILKVPVFEALPGELVAVCGRVGAGKSSLVAAALGNMDLVKGSCQIGGAVSYVPQNPWCQNLTLKENIVFGQEWDEDKYNHVIHDCALELDLQILPKGDETKAGLRGINLSGGQRQRLNLARAAYFHGDVFLLDNALSAVDHHTANHIFDNLLKNSVSDMAIVLITHQVEFLPKCDKVCIMDGGNQLYFGPFNPEAQRILSTVLPAQHLLSAAEEGPREAPKKKKLMARTKSGNLTRSASSTLSLGNTNIGTAMNGGKKKAREGDKTTLSFMQAIGVYVKAGLISVFLISLFFFVAAQSSRQASDYSIRWWTGDGQGWFANPGLSPFGIPGGNSYALLYGILTIMFLVLMLCRGTFYHLWALGASQRLHTGMTHNVLHAPLGFFLRNPIGDMLVAFSKDQDIMDENLVDTLHYLGIYGFILLSTAVTVSIVIPTFAAFAAALVVISFTALFVYLPAATALKKHRAETAGDLVGLVAETLEGLPIINAFAQRQYFLDTAEYRIDLHHKAIYNAESLSLWLAFYCDLFGAILVLAVCSFSMAQRATLGASAVGLAFSNVIQLLVFFSWTIRSVADGISYMGATEKIGWLAKGPVPQEGGAVTGADGSAIAEELGNSKAAKPGKDAGKLIVSVAAGGEGVDLGGSPVPEGWPRQGVVEFCDVWMRYAPTAPFALKGVSFRLEHGEKVGVVGRTGSGKSTLLLALYRMFVLDKGHVKVDGVDSGTLSLRRLRPALSIIPQEPVVFSGTVRSNLDPWAETTDGQMWDVLRQVGLETAAKSAGGLDGRLDGTGGQAWSLGQQQLMCLARAALKRSPILCLDEATAAMDPHTEQQVVTIIKRIFSDRTTITIAHRLDTVIEGDKIIVMEQGVLQEFAAPKTLLDDHDSMFSKLIDKSGKEAAAALRAVAAETFAAKAEGREVPVPLLAPQH